MGYAAIAWHLCDRLTTASGKPRKPSKLESPISRRKKEPGPKVLDYLLRAGVCGDVH